jgi:hypothetical protein
MLRRKLREAKGSPELSEALTALMRPTVRPVGTFRMATAADMQRAPGPVVAPKTPGRVQQSIRDSARGEPCTVRIVGACNSDPATSVWAHWPGLDGDRGMGIKALDLCGAIACSGCHDVVDMRAPLPQGATRESVEIDWHRGHLRSLVRLKQKGVI